MVPQPDEGDYGQLPPLPARVWWRILAGVCCLAGAITAIAVGWQDVGTTAEANRLERLEAVLWLLAGLLAAACCLIAAGQCRRRP